MLPESSKLLLDIQHKAYKADARCRAAVERKFEVAGEACVRLRERFPEIYERLHDAPRLVGLRNRIIH